MGISGPLDAAIEGTGAYLAELDRRGYPLSVPGLQPTNLYFSDNDAPDGNLPRFVQDWNASGQPVTMRLATLSQFLDRLRREVGVEHRRREGILAAQRSRKVLGPQAAARTELEDRLAGPHVKAVPHCQRPPAQLHRRRRRVAQPVRFPAALHRVMPSRGGAPSGRRRGGHDGERASTGAGRPSLS